MNKIIMMCLLVAIFVTTAGQTKFFEKAVPVWASGRQTEKNLIVSFRANITWDGNADVMFRLTACSDYRAYVNGVFLGHGPCVAGLGHLRVDEHRLDKWLKPGQNIIKENKSGTNFQSRMDIKPKLKTTQTLNSYLCKYNPMSFTLGIERNNLLGFSNPVGLKYHQIIKTYRV